MWETMGRTGISDRTKERLGASDVAVVEFRRIMVEAAKAMRDSGKAIGQTQPHIPQAKISSFEGIVPKSTDWRTLGVAAEELALGQPQDRVA
jgi:phthalate 4,5-dioxygenase oxygenase subunit